MFKVIEKSNSNLTEVMVISYEVGENAGLEALAGEG
jgi:hypothetical protein